MLRTATAVILASTLLTGCSVFGRKSSDVDKIAAATSQAPSMGVNAFLWRASLETLDFMPLEQVDPFGGVIVTDYYASSEAPNERFKANVYILDTGLRADALKVSIFKQENQGGSWRDSNADADTARQIENAILTRARQLYQATVDS
jgi:hypothetical protein